MKYKHVVIVDNSVDLSRADNLPSVYNGCTLSEAIHHFRSKSKENANVDGVCLVYTGAAWRFIGYLKDIVS